MAKKPGTAGARGITRMPGNVKQFSRLLDDALFLDALFLFGDMNDPEERERQAAAWAAATLAHQEDTCSRPPSAVNGMNGSPAGPARQPKGQSAKADQPPRSGTIRAPRQRLSGRVSKLRADRSRQLRRQAILDLYELLRELATGLYLRRLVELGLVEEAVDQETDRAAARWASAWFVQALEERGLLRRIAILP